MKIQLKNDILSIFLVLAIVITNFFVYYTSVCNSEILQSKDIYGRRSFTYISSVHHQKKLIMNLSDDTNTDIAQMLREIAYLEDCSIAVDYMKNKNKSTLSKWKELSYAESKAYAEKLYKECEEKYSKETEPLSTLIARDISDLEKTIAYLRYLNGYHDYIKNIETNSEFLSDVSIYQNDTPVYNFLK